MLGSGVATASYNPFVVSIVPDGTLPEITRVNNVVELRIDSLVNPELGSR